MPVIQASLIQGYDESTRRQLCERLTDAVMSCIAAPPDGVTVLLHEIPPANYMRGRRSRTPGPPSPGPVACVQGYLQAMERRDLDAAGKFLAPEFRMTFPGGADFSRPEEVVEWARTRYRSIRKTYEGWDESFSAEGWVVFCYGTLSGEWLDGSPFSGIRFIDRFQGLGAQLHRQQVWNDLAEMRPDLS
jgi:phenylpyruvate tautomerase PptA (4-oxalocrotonate tautomerase family)